MYGIDILDDRHSLRRIHNLIRRLPADSDYAAETGGADPVDRVWTTSEYLLALVVDLIAQGNWQFAAAHRKFPPPKPKPLPRPRQVHEKKQARESGKAYWPGKTIVVKREAPWQAETSASESPTLTSDSAS